MDAVRRIKLIRVIEKLEKQPVYSVKLGMKNVSFVKKEFTDK